MKRKQSELETRIWTFGAWAPKDPTERERVNDQLRLASDYYNKLIEIENARRAAYRVARLAFGGPALEQAENSYLAAVAAVQEARDGIRLLKQEGLKPASSQVDDVKVLIATREQAKKTLDTERQRVQRDPAFEPYAKQINADWSAAVRAARAACGLYWGTYLLVEKSIEAARKSKLDPRARPFRGTGRIGVQIHGVLTTAGVFTADSTVLQIDPLPADTWDTRSGRRHAETTVRLRVGSINRDPMWANFHVILSRKLPPTGVIKWAWIKVSRIGPRTKYELQLSLESQSFSRVTTSPSVVAVDIGWRQLPEGVRVGYAVDDQKRSFQCVIPNSLIDSARFACELRGHQDRAFDHARWLLNYWRTWSGHGPEPEWLDEELTTLLHWRSPARLASVVGRWKEWAKADAELGVLWQAWRSMRKATGRDLLDTFSVVRDWAIEHTQLEPVLVYLEWWRRKNRHLYEWASIQRERCLRHRNEIYKIFAARLVRTYGTIVLEDFDLRAFTRKAADEDIETNFTRPLRTLAAPGELRGAIVAAASKTQVAKLSAVNTTRTCHCCGYVNTEADWAFPDERVQTCYGCRTDWDQDDNAGHVLLASYFEGSSGGAVPGGARKSTNGADSKASGSARPKRAGARKSRPSQTAVQPNENTGA